MSIKNTFGGISKTAVTYENGNTELLQQYFSNEKVWELNETSKTYRGYLFDSKNYLNADPIDVEKAFQTDETNTKVTYYREEPPVGLAGDTLFPFEIASNYTRDTGRWEIEKQNEALLDHNTIVLRGKLDNTSPKKNLAETFRFWVDKDTGILI
ncbi:hypothetical protein J9303_03535 [Bacillaceae bacterium Marseille-Q3522]|nr:hypothetical protein [Bacillaceae bacterium Marseille-Q3522]